MPLCYVVMLEKGKRLAGREERLLHGFRSCCGAGGRLKVMQPKHPPRPHREPGDRQQGSSSEPGMEMASLREPAASPSNVEVGNGAAFLVLASPWLVAAKPGSTWSKVLALSPSLELLWHSQERNEGSRFGAGVACGV